MKIWSYCFCFLLLSGFMQFSNLKSQTVNHEWPCLQQNSRHTGQSPYAGPENPVLAWKVKPGQGVHGSPVIDSNGTVYVPGLKGAFYAVGPQGKVEWRFELSNQDEFFDPELQFSGTPTIGSDASIYVASEVGWSGLTLTSSLFSFANEALKWQIPLAGTETMTCVTGPDGSIYVGSNKESEDIYKLYALFPSGGQQWELDLVGPVGIPAVGPDGTIYVAAGSGATSPYSGALYAINSDGSIKWRNDNVGGIGGYLYGPAKYPVVCPNGLVLVSNEQTLAAVDQSGEIAWNFGAGQFRSWVRSNPAVSSDGTVYFVMQSDKDSLYAVHPDGTRKWGRYMGTKTAPPVIDVNENIWIGAEDGKVYRYDPEGNLQWSGYLAAGNISAMAIDSSGVLYFVSSDENLYASFSPDSAMVPDLTVSGLSFDPVEAVNAGARTVLTVELSNMTDQGPARCRVVAYHTDISAGHIIGSDYVFVPNAACGYGKITWHTQGLDPGEYDVIITIETANPPEENSSNNQYTANYILLPSLHTQINVGSDTAWIEPGTYMETFDMIGNKIVKSLAGPERTILRSDGTGDVVTFNYLDSTAVLDGFTISGGERGVCFERGGGIVRNCIITRNKDGLYSIGSYVYDSPIIEHNLIINNSRLAMDTNNSFALLNKNTLVNNAAGVKGYGYYSPSPLIINCILWNNHDDLVETGSAVYSCIQNGDPGEGNIHSNPTFVDPDNGDYHLTETSPCIDAGYPDEAFNDPDGSRADMGAFYCATGSRVGDERSGLLPDKYHLGCNFPNPFNSQTVIEYQLPKDTRIRLEIFNIRGELIKVLKHELEPAGVYQIIWDGRDEYGKTVAGGLYVYRLNAGGFSKTEKMILLK